jgi:hypothetical protein
VGTQFFHIDGQIVALRSSANALRNSVSTSENINEYQEYFLGVKAAGAYG